MAEENGDILRSQDDGMVAHEPMGALATDLRVIRGRLDDLERNAREDFRLMQKVENRAWKRDWWLLALCVMNLIALVGLAVLVARGW